jgi:AcrR family transcriptional regulator
MTRHNRTGWQKAYTREAVFWIIRPFSAGKDQKNTPKGTNMGLRERKKDRTRLQLLHAALELIGQQGFEETTIMQIAAAIDVSPRTVLRYFPTKEDIIVSWVEDGMNIFLACMEQRPADEPAHQSLLACARELLKTYQERADFYLIIERTIASSSSISARKQEMSAALGKKVSQILAERTENNGQAILRNELYPIVVFSILRVVIRTWVSLDGKRPLLDLFNEAAALIQFQA